MLQLLRAYSLHFTSSGFSLSYRGYYSNIGRPSFSKSTTETFAGKAALINLSICSTFICLRRVLLHDNDRIYRLNLEIAIAKNWNYSCPPQPHVVLRIVRWYFTLCRPAFIECRPFWRIWRILHLTRMVIQSIICTLFPFIKHRFRVLSHTRDIELSDSEYFTGQKMWLHLLLIIDNIYSTSIQHFIIDDIHSIFFRLLDSVFEDLDCSKRIEADLKRLRDARYVGGRLLWAW